LTAHVHEKSYEQDVKVQTGDGGMRTRSKTKLQQTCQEVKTISVTIQEEDEEEQTQKQSIHLQETSKRQQKNSSPISDHLKKYFEKLKKVFLHH